MIRTLLLPAVAVVGLGAATASIDPGLLAGPRGEPLILAGPQDAVLEPASFYAEGCRPALLFSEQEKSGVRIVAFAFRPDPEEVAVAVEDYADQAAKPAETMVLVFNRDGDLIAAGDPETLHISDTGCELADEAAGPV